MSNKQMSEFGRHLFNMINDMNSVLYGGQIVVLQPQEKPVPPTKPVITTHIKRIEGEKHE